VRDDVERAQVSAGEPRAMLADLANAPPLIQIARALRWEPLPLTIKAGRHFAEAQPLAPVQPTPRAAENPIALRVEGVSASYGRETALRGISLSAHVGQIVAVIGRNGSGKSTLLKRIVGLHPRERGRVFVNADDVTVKPATEICRRVGYLPQDPNMLLFADTVRDELATTLRHHGRGSDGDARMSDAIDSLLRELGLLDKADAYPRDLSAGERQRVAFAAIAIVEPAVLLLDEPTRGLDPTAKHDLRALLSRWRERGAAIVVATHDVELVAEVADHVVLLSRGEVLAVGGAAAVLGASPFFATQAARLYPESGAITADDVLRRRAEYTRRA
jgi:energy-coupling factor transport system ATP-binding protein